jgi:hypothetical protein
MNELIAQLTQRVGLSPEQARLAADTVLGFVKSRLPAPLASQLDQIIGSGAAGATGAAGSAEGLGGIAKEIGGMFGR